MGRTTVKKETNLTFKINKKWAIPLVLLIVGILSFAVYTIIKDEPDRGDILAEIAETNAALDESPNNAKLAYELANLRYQGNLI